MDLKKYWEGRAESGTWSTRRLYDGPLNAHNYNFVARREGVRELLEAHGQVGKILDVGCGTGDYFELATQMGASYHGVDFAWRMLREAAARVEDHGRRHLFVTAAGARLPYADGTFDVVLAIGYIEYFADPTPPLQEIARVLKPGGLLIMQSFKPDLFCTLNRGLARVRRVCRRVATRGRRGRGGLKPTLYTRRGLDRVVSAFGFVPVDHRFKNFWVCPRFLQLKWPRAYIAFSEALDRADSAIWSVLAVNYIGKYVLDGGQAARTEQP